MKRRMLPSLLAAFAFCLWIAPTAAAFDFQWVNPLPAGGGLRSVIHAAGKFVAVGYGGTILTSEDGLQWTGRASGSSADLYDVIWDGARFVAVGSARTVLASTDGITWSELYNNSIPASIFQSVCFDGEQYVATSNNAVWTSPDGSGPWTMHNTNLPTNFMWFRDIDWNGSQYLIVGDNGKIFTSTDADIWTERTSGVGYSLYAVARNGSGYVAVGNLNTVLTSPDGIDWTPQETGYTGSYNNLYGIQWDGSLFTAVGNLTGNNISTILTSPNGTDWAQLTVPESALLYGLAEGGGRHVLVGSYGSAATILASGDGTSYESLRTGTTRLLDEVVWDGSRFVAVGEKATVASSPDGITWETLSIPYSVGYDSTLHAYASDGDIRVAAGDLSTLLTSPDGITWTRRSTGFPAIYLDLLWDGGQFILAGSSSGAGLWTSTDGVTWQRRYTNGNANTRIDAVAFSGALYVASGHNISTAGSGFTVTSADGINWEPHTSPTMTVEMPDIVWDGSRFVGVSWGGYIAASTDGITWTEIDNNINASLLFGVAHNDSGYVAVGRTFLGSANGTDWSEILVSPTPPELRGVASDGDRFVVVGANGTILATSARDDLDGDGYAAGAEGGDCNDRDGSVHPGAAETLCDGIDQDCDGLADDDVNADGDPVSLCAGDCDDADPAVYPGRAETLCDGIDQDCDGPDDDDVNLDGDPVTFCSGDCDDNSASMYPGNVETCDGIDNDCDDEIDEGLLVDLYFDYDLDGYGDGFSRSGCWAGYGEATVAGDCDDTNEWIYPGAYEWCNGYDDDCDGSVDEDVTSAFYADADGDGYGDAADTVQACSAPAGFVTDASDCDDASAARFPGNPEICDGIDNDCDDSVDEDVTTTYYADADEDGYGDAAVPVQACSAPAGFVTDASDCDDASAARFPGNPEICDGVDNDCDDSIDEGLDCSSSSGGGGGGCFLQAVETP